jgi:hypothetical protein
MKPTKITKTKKAIIVGKESKQSRKARWTRTAVDVRTGKRTKAPMWGILDRIVTPKPDKNHKNAPQSHEPWGH